MFQDKLTKEIAAAAAQIKTEPTKNVVNGNSVEGAVVSIMANEELKGNQHKIDANKNGKVDAHDFKLLRAKKDMKKEEVEMNEEDAYNKDRYAVKNGKATKDNPTHMGSPNYKDQPHHVWATSAEHALKKSMKKEEVEQLDEVGDTPAGRKALHKYVDKAISTSMYNPSKVENRVKGMRKATSRLYKDNYYGKKNEEVELDESAGKITHYVAKKDLSNHKDYMDREGFDTHTRNLSKTHSLHKTHMGIMATDSPGEHGHHTEAGAQPASEYKKNIKALKKEEVEPIEEAGDFIKGVKRFMAGKKNPSDVRDAHLAKSAFSSDPKVKERESRRYDRVQNVLSKEDVEQMDEAFPTVADAKKRMASKDSSFEKKKISTGTVYSRKYKAEPDDADDMPKKKAKTMKEMLDIYRQHGAESLIENLLIEEPTNDEYKKEAEIAQAKSEGKIRNDKGIAKPATQGVKMEEVEIELLDADEINGVQIDNIEERSMTDAEMNKREEIVKSMKKGIQGFKDRYGKDAKSVMYATANKQSMKEQADESESEHYKAGHAYASDHAQDSGFKVTARARKKEMLADNPHKKGTPEHADWHRGALHGHQVGLDNM